MPSELLEEMWASADGRQQSRLGLKLQHPAWLEPLRIVSGDDLVGEGNTTVDLPEIEGGPKYAWRKVAFGFIRPGADSDGPTDAKVRIDGGAAQLEQYLEAGQGTQSPIIVSAFEWLILDGDIGGVSGPEDVIPGLELRNVVLDESGAEGELRWRDGRTLNVPTGPDAFFDRENYPNLFR